ncbi:MAG: creatininase family protein [Bacillota bacterium]
MALQSGEQALVLHDLTWTELKEYLPGIKVAIVPVGSTEQHGPHMTFATDTVRAYEFSRRLAARLFPRALVTTPINLGISTHHMMFPGTITLRPETFMAVVMDVAWSLKQHGITRLFFANGHGGNRPALTLLMARLRDELGVKAAWVSFTSMASDVIREHVKSPLHGHACEGEVSQALYLAPQVVRQDRLTPGAIRPGLAEASPWRAETALSFAAITENGCLGDATRASLELGRAIIEKALERVASFLEDFMADRELPGW